MHEGCSVMTWKSDEESYGWPETGTNNHTSKHRVILRLSPCSGSLWTDQRSGFLTLSFIFTYSQAVWENPDSGLIFKQLALPWGGYSHPLHSPLGTCTVTWAQEWDRGLREAERLGLRPPSLESCFFQKPVTSPVWPRGLPPMPINLCSTLDPQPKAILAAWWSPPTNSWWSLPEVVAQLALPRNWTWEVRVHLSLPKPALCLVVVAGAC